jgi:hypothetical protein
MTPGADHGPPGPAHPSSFTVSLRRLRSEPSPGRITETRLDPGLDGRGAEIRVVLTHHCSFWCSRLTGGRESSTTPGRPPIGGRWTKGCPCRGAMPRTCWGDLSAVVAAEGGPLRKEKAASGGGSGKTESDDDQFIASPESAVIASDESWLSFRITLPSNPSRVVDRALSLADRVPVKAIMRPVARRETTGRRPGTAIA